MEKLENILCTEDYEKISEIIKEGKIKIGELFRKKFLVFNIFGIEVDEDYTGKMNLKMKRWKKLDR